MANLSFKQGDLSNISNNAISDGAVYFCKDNTEGHSAHGYIFYDVGSKNVDRLPINGAGYYIALDKKTNSIKNMYIENNLFNEGAGAYIGVGYGEKDIWLHRSSSSSSSNRGLWCPLYGNTDSNVSGAWILRLGAGIGDDIGEYTYIGSPPYVGNDGKSTNNRTIRPMTNSGYSLGDSSFPWATAHINEMIGNASTATILKNARTIAVGNQSKTFDGSADIEIPINISTTWTAGTSAGPIVKVVVNGKSSEKAIPIASDSNSGVITIGSQAFAGNKTFNGYTFHSRGIQINADSNLKEGLIIYDHDGSSTGVKRLMSSFWVTTVNHKGTGDVDKIKPAALWTVKYHDFLDDEEKNANPATSNYINKASVCLSLYDKTTAAFYPTESSLSSIITSTFLGTSSHRWAGIYSDTIVCSYFRTSTASNAPNNRYILIGNGEDGGKAYYIGSLSIPWDGLYSKNITAQNVSPFNNITSDQTLGLEDNNWTRLYVKAIRASGNIYPSSTDTQYLGLNNARWGTIYAKNGNFTGNVDASTYNGETLGNLSDSRLKIVQSNNILEKDLLIYNQLQPVVYKYKDVLPTENHSRTHIGFLAQDVEILIDQNGLTSEDCALVQIENLEEDSGYRPVCQDGKKYYLNYNELHGLHTLKNHQQDARLAELENKNKDLENTIATLKTQIELLKLAIGG